MDNATLVGIGTVVGAAIAAFVASRAAKSANHQLTQDKGENGHATVRRTLREIQEDVRDTRDLAARVEGRFDTLDDKVDRLGDRVSDLEHVTGLRKKVH